MPSRQGTLYLTPRGVSPEGVILSGALSGAKSKDLFNEPLRFRPKQQGSTQGERVGKISRPLIYLASRSSRRQALLTGMKIPFRVVRSRYRERGCRKTSAEILCVRHATGKVRQAVLPKAARFVLGGDTIVWHQGCGLGKPRTRAGALGMLRRLAGKRHAVYTGLAVLDRKTGHLLTGFAKTDVWMKPVRETWLEKYVDTIHPFDKAGAYAIQGRPKIVRKIRGSYSNVVGLPRELLRKMLKEMRRMSDVSTGERTCCGPGAGR